MDEDNTKRYLPSKGGNLWWYFNLLLIIIYFIIFFLALLVSLFFPVLFIGPVAWGIALFLLLLVLRRRHWYYIYETGPEGIKKINRFTSSVVFIGYRDITAVNYTFDKPFTQVFGKDYYGKFGPLHRVEISSGINPTIFVFENKDVLLDFLDSIKPYVGKKIVSS